LLRHAEGAQHQRHGERSAAASRSDRHRSAVQIANATQCNPDFQVWAIGSRSQWNVTKDFYVGLDVIYMKLNSASINNGAPFVPAGGVPFTGAPASNYQTADQDAVTVTWRVHRDIVP